MNHVLFGFIAGFRYRRQLATILRRSAGSLATDSVIPERIKESGVTVLALDFDGVLAPHGRVEPLPEAAAWLAQCSRFFGEERIFILSNKPTPERSAWFCKHFPEIRFISDVRKKPYPDGLIRVFELSGASPGEVMLLDDRLLTGVLATCLAGTGVSYISRPYTDFSGNPMHEIFFAALRWVERVLIRCVSLRDERRIT